MTMSDRFLTSRKKRLLLYRKYDGKCAKCGTGLPQGWHADHVVPYTETRRTNVHGMQPLCPECNLEKSDSTPNDMDTPSGSPQNIVDLSSARRGQKEAVMAIYRRLLNGKDYTSVVLPTGYGKSDVIRLSAHILKEMGLIGTSLVLSTTDLLRGQIVEEGKMVEFKNRYEVKGPLRYDEVEKAGLRYHEDDPFLISSTIGLVHHHRQNFCDWIEQVHFETGKPVGLFVDETHSYTDENRWGETIRELQEAGAHCVVLTATPFREDGDSLIGFDEGNVEVLDENEVEQYTWKDADDPDKIIIEEWAGKEYEYRLEGDVHVTFQEAWEEDLLCQISHKTIDARLFEVDLSTSEIQEEDLLLSELSKTRAQKYLQDFCEDPSVVRDGVQKMVYWLNHYRGETKALANTGAIVFTKDDRGTSRVNHHAKQVKEEIEEQAPGLTVKIATSADDGTDGGAIMRDFCEENSDIDVLVVKQMASEGLDAKRAKIVLDLSNVRTLNSFIQRANRATRPWRGVYTSVLITLKDPKSTELFDRFVGEQGGATRTELDRVDSWEKEREEQGPEDPIGVDETVDSDVFDSKGNQAFSEDLWIASRVLDEFPELVRMNTVPEIIRKGRRLIGEDSLPEEGIDEVENLSDRREKLREEFNFIRNKTYGILKQKGRITDDEGWFQTFATQVYKQANIPQKYWDKASESSQSLISHVKSEDLLVRIRDAALNHSSNALGYELDTEQANE